MDGLPAWHRFDTGEGFPTMEPQDQALSSSDRPTVPASGDHFSARGYRLDGPHRDFSQGESVPRPARRDALLDLVAQLQAEVADQDERETVLAEREQHLARTQADFEGWRAEQQEQIEAALSRLATREQALEDGERRLVAQEESLLHLSTRLEIERTEIMREKESNERDRAAIQEELTALQHDRAFLRPQLMAEIAADRESLVQEQRVLLERTQALADAERQSHARIDALLQQERQGLWQTLSLEWNQRHTAFETERKVWDEQRVVIQTQLEEQRAHCQAALDQLDAELAERRAVTERELAERRATVDAEIAAARQSWEAMQSTTVADQQRERSVLESRLRFQQEHLEKARIDLERVQMEFRRERQQERFRLEEADRQSQRRLLQLGLYRDALGEQAKSLDREAATLARVRQAWDDSVASSRAAFDAETAQWRQDTERQRLEITRQQEALAKHSESIDGRRHRLDKLRIELEETHRSNLELRLAVEEAWAQIAQAVGSDEEARLRVEQARQGLSLYYQELHAGLMAQRRDLLDLENRLHHDRGEFHAERQTLVQWLSERDEALRAQEADVATKLHQAIQEEAAWREMQNRWLTERLEAESVIRRLLGELGDRHREDVATQWSVSALMAEATPMDDASFEIPARALMALSDAPSQTNAA